MSSWIGDWERNLLTNKKRGGKYRTQCKLGGEAILEDEPARWVTDSRMAPLGLSCVPHLKEKATELGLILEPETPAAPVQPGRVQKVIRPRKPRAELVHGKPGTYTNHGCRCDLCIAANTARTTAYRAARRQREVAA